MQSAQEVRLETVNIRRLKDFYEKTLPHDSTLKSLALSEPDELPIDEAIHKFKIFLKLFEKEKG